MAPGGVLDAGALLLEAIADAVQRLDHIEIVVALLEFLA
jgi:hypothetical protein